MTEEDYSGYALPISGKSVKLYLFSSHRKIIYCQSSLLLYGRIALAPLLPTPYSNPRYSSTGKGVRNQNGFLLDRRREGRDGEGLNSYSPFLIHGYKRMPSGRKNKKYVIGKRLKLKPSLSYLLFIVSINTNNK